MKIPAGSFDVNLNDLLHRLNHNNGLANADAIYKKAMADVQPKIDQTNKVIGQKEKELTDLTNQKSDNNIKYVDAKRKKTKQEIQQAREDLRAFAEGKRYESSQQINEQYDKLWGHLKIDGKKINNPQDLIDAEHNIEDGLHGEISSQIKDQQSFTQSVIDDKMPNYVQAQMADMRNSFPTNQVMYYPPNQYPSSASAGDICWQSGNFNGQHITAKAFEYDGFHWNPIKTTGEFYSANIYSPNIQGGAITGSQFLSDTHNITGQAVFNVDQHGNIYANNLKMDLYNNGNATAVNEISYNTLGTREPGGLNFNNGTMHMTAVAHQRTGPPIKDYATDFRANTFLEPDYLKLRTILPHTTDNNTEDGKGTLIGRTDVRGGNIEISDQWSQNTGIRLGYWNDQWALNDPLIVIGDYNRSDDYTALGSTGIISQNVTTNGFMLNSHEITVENGRLKVNHQAASDPFDPTNLNNEISDIEYRGVGVWGSLSGHNDRLNTHRDILKDRNGNANASQNRIADLEQSVQSRLDIADGEYGNVSFKDLSGNGHFAFHNDITVLGNEYDTNKGGYRPSALLVGGESSGVGSGVYKDEVDTPTLYLGNSYNVSLDVDNYGDLRFSGQSGNSLGIGFQGNAIYSTHGGPYGDHSVYFNDNSGAVPIRAGDIYSHGRQITDINGLIGGGKHITNNITKEVTKKVDTWASTGNYVFSGANISATGSYDPGAIYVKDYQYEDVYCQHVISHGPGRASRLSVKKDIEDVNTKNALATVLNTNIKSWRYQSDAPGVKKHIGPIIDDINGRNNSKYYVPDALIMHTPDAAFSTDDAISYLFLSIQELQKQNSQLTQRLAKIEFQK